MFLNSEIGRLRKVLLHRPCDALERLTPSNCHALLFDDILYSEKAAEEHRAFEDILRSRGVEILILGDLLEETVGNQTAREWLLKNLVKRLYGESSVGKDVYSALIELDPKELAKCLVAGITWKELGITPKGLSGMVNKETNFIIPPLPNHYFTRDSSCWIGGGVSINPMFWAARRGETLNVAAIYKFHPHFAQNNHNVWLDGSDEASETHSIEGGDVLVMSKDCILIGISERTTPQAIETLAKSLFASGDKKKVIAIEIPPQRTSMHLDTVMTMIDHETFCISIAHVEKSRSWSITPGDHPHQLVISENKDLFQTIAAELGLSKLRLISVGMDDSVSQEREQWTDGGNLLALAPGVVIAYECNKHTNKKLAQEGIEIIRLAGSELSRGRGGSRCMSCPLVREAI
jgi:arginine deiminase